MFGFLLCWLQSSKEGQRGSINYFDNLGHNENQVERV